MSARSDHLGLASRRNFVAAGVVLALIVSVLLSVAVGRSSTPIPRADPVPHSSTGNGYWLVDTSGAVRAYGAAPGLGSVTGPLAAPVVDVTTTADGQGYWLVAADGGVFAYGDAPFLGSMGGQRLAAPIVGMAATADGQGYWLVAADGGVFAYGDAAFDGSMAGHPLAGHIVGMAAMPDGNGYWLVAADGGVFAYGGAQFEGSAGGVRLAAPVVGMAAAPDGKGYWLVAVDGGVFAYGGAPFEGSAGGVRLAAPIVGMAAAPDGSGYWLVAADGGVFAYGDAPFEGSAAGSVASGQRATAIATSPATAPPSGGNCTNPTWQTSDAEGTENVDGGPEDWWVNNDAWSGSHGPQTISVCNQSSWNAVSNQPDDGGQVETYPDTEYDVGGRNAPSTTPISGWGSITSTFAETFPSGSGGWDAGYDLWLNNWSTEIMIWNEWSGGQSYWPEQATTSLTLDGVPYSFYDNGGELMFFRGTQVKSGAVDILAAFGWLVTRGLVSATDVPTQLEYGVEVCYTSGSETFPLTGLTFSLSK
jgi:hypothetical protein